LESLSRELVKAFVVLKNGREATDEMRMDILGFAEKKWVLPSSERN
jgi:acyl-coenzyme A synthetase/AMP-(fatty) acid ligase